MSLLSRTVRLARTDQRLAERLWPLVRRAMSLPEFVVGAKDILWLAKGKHLQIVPGVKATSMGDQATVHVPLRYRGDKGRWQEAELMVVVKSSPGEYDNSTRTPIGMITNSPNAAPATNNTIDGGNSISTPRRSVCVNPIAINAQN